MSIKSISKGVTISPKKVRRILGNVKGKKVETALEILKFLTTPAAKEVAKAIKSAASNAENNNMLSMEDLKIVDIRADVGPTLKRFRARARGRAGRIIKRSSHITVLVDEEGGAS
jgi:large subunit ribosomal protein L22